MTNLSADNNTANAPVDLDASLDRLGVTIAERMKEREEMLVALKRLVAVADKERWADRYALFSEKCLAAAEARHVIAKAEGR